MKPVTISDLFADEVETEQEYKYIFHIEARKKGAIGKPCAYSAVRTGKTMQEARLKLYDEFEHIHIASVTKKDIK